MGLLAASATACGFSRVDTPLTLRADRRLEIVSPDNDELVTLPVTVRWKVEDFQPVDGNHFAVFVDKVPIKPRRILRLRICTKLEQRPIQPGEDRRKCDDDREKVFQTTDTSLRLECLETKDTGSDRAKNTHRITVILLGSDGMRVGEAAYSVTLRVQENAQLRRCNGEFAEE